MGFEFSRGKFNRGAEHLVMNNEGRLSLQALVEKSGMQAERIRSSEDSIMRKLRMDADFQLIVANKKFEDSTESANLSAKFRSEKIFEHIEEDVEREALLVAIAKAESEKPVH